jgi:hypothetical protein
MFVILSVFLFLFSSCETKEPSSCPQVLDYAQINLPHLGILENRSGFIYVKVDDAYIHQLISFLQSQGFEEPPYFGKPELVGAHITVVYPDEVKKYGLKTLSEEGSIISFTLKNCKVIHPPQWKEVDEIYLIVVDAPELDSIRSKYGLPKRHYAFHITIGIKPKLTRAA